MSNIKLSIVVLAFRSADKLRITLQSVLDSHCNFAYEVFVVDNNSGDGTAEMVAAEFPQFHLIRNPENSGFSKGNNIAIRQAHGEFILLLNPDTKLTATALQLCLERIAQDQRIAILGAKLIKADGTLDLACRRGFPNPANSFLRFSGIAKIFPKAKWATGYNVTFLPEDREAEIDAVSGAFLLIRQSVIEKIGLLDEKFFMYGEDLDWCYRAKQAGYKVLYYPKAVVWHYKGQSSRKVPYRALYAFHQAMAIFYDKHYRQKYPFILNWLVHAGIWLRFAALAAGNLFRKHKFVSK